MAHAEDETAARARRAALLRALDWGKLLRQLTKKASSWGFSAMVAEDLAQDTVTYVLKTGAASWDPEADPTAHRYLLYTLDWKRDAMLSKQTLRQKLQPTDVDSEAVDATPPDSDRGADGELLRGEAAMRNLERLRASLAKFPLALSLLELCAREGQLDPRDVAVRLGVPVKEVYTAEALLRRHVKRLRADGSDPEVGAGALSEEGAA
jgi:DNA-directed RNA polymerase specialized sigma24 family protein